MPESPSCPVVPLPLLEYLEKMNRSKAKIPLWTDMMDPHRALQYANDCGFARCVQFLRSQHDQQQERINNVRIAESTSDSGAAALTPDA